VVTKEVVAICVLLACSLFADGIPRRLLLGVSLAKRLLLLCDSDGFAKRSLNFCLVSTKSREKHVTRANRSTALDAPPMI